jgi:predicted Zn-dependent protease
LLGEELRRGTVTLRVSTPEGDRDVRFGAVFGCPSNVELVPGDAVNAWADGSRVIVGEGLLRLCATDADLALVIAHEMAHNLLRHRERLPAASSGLLASTGAGSAAMRESEEAADRLAVGLAKAAAYDLSGAEPFLSRLLDRALRPAPTHPDRERRLALLRAAIAETHALVPAAPVTGPSPPGWQTPPRAA